MTASYLRPGTVNMHVWQPSFSGGTWTPARWWLGSVDEKIASYRHTLRAHGGYWEASLEFGCRVDQAEDWLDSGLARHVQCFDEAHVLAFEGYVNEVQVSVGGYSITRGPLSDLANRGALVFTALDTTYTPPRAGSRARTGVANVTASQERYGIHYRVVSGGDILAASSLQLRDSYLAEAAYPAVDRKLTLGKAAPPAVSLTVYGYVRMLDFPYNNGLAGNTTVDAKIPLVLAAEPNGLFTGTPQSIATNATAVEAAEDEDNEGWSVISTGCEYGDASYNRYVASVSAGRAFTYAAIPTTVDYQLLLRDPHQPITTVAGTEVPPWRVEAGRWLLVTDWFIGRVPPGTPLRDDPRALYIESVDYEAPRTVSVAGGRADTITQRMARMGLASIGGP